MRNPLVELAQQFGEATGLRRDLRSALGTPPNSDDIRDLREPHRRGSILVAAVFDAYFSIYLRRTDDLFRIFRAGGGGSLTDVPGPLADRLAGEVSETAQLFFTVCVRALDYCPPVDIDIRRFPLRAVVTADADLDPFASDRSARRARARPSACAASYPRAPASFPKARSRGRVRTSCASIG